MSLSSEPAFSSLKDKFICGYRNIAGKRYAGASGKHQVDGNAIDTTNGAGPHNIQVFILAADGTVLTCLPGYWHAQDLANEFGLAEQLNQIWIDPNLSRAEKDAKFRELQLAHLNEHTKAERHRSRMQGFDIQYEIAHRLYNTDVFYDPHAIDPNSKKAPPRAVKTTDVIMHERMAQRPFIAYDDFDVAKFSDYGKPFYDKHEDIRTADGEIPAGANKKREAFIGNDPRAHPVQQQVKRQGKSVAKQGLMIMLRSAMHR